MTRICKICKISPEDSESLILFCFNDADHGREQDSDLYKRADKLVQDIMKARTTSQFESVIEDAAPDNLHAIPQLVRSLLPSTRLDQLIIRPGESGGMLTQSENQLELFCSKEKLKKSTVNCLIGMSSVPLLSKISVQTLSGKSKQ